MSYGPRCVMRVEHVQLPYLLQGSAPYDGLTRPVTAKLASPSGLTVAPIRAS